MQVPGAWVIFPPVATARPILPRVLAAALILAAPALQAAEFFVDRHGWHSGIVLARAAIPAEAWPPGVVERDFAGCQSLELGWGDRNFYTAPHPGVLLALRAALFFDPGVLHIVGFERSASRALPNAEFVRVRCTEEQLADLCRALGASFGRDATGRAQPLGRGLYGFKSQFYTAHGRYWIGNTCNSWTLREARTGGVPTRVGPLGTLSSGAVTVQVRRLVAAKPQAPPSSPRTP